MGCKRDPETGRFLKGHGTPTPAGSAREQLCVECGRPAVEWANISGQYHRDLADYEAMCRRCHRRRDREGGSRYDAATRSLRPREKEASQ